MKFISADKRMGITFASAVINYRVLIAGLALIILAVFFEQLAAGGAGILVNPETYIALCKEIGFALIIGFVVAIGIEASARREFNATVDEQINAIKQEVFRATFRRSIPPGVILEVEELVLKADFVRHAHRLVYHLSVHDASDLDPKDRSLPNMRVVVFDVDMSYEVENVSLIEREYVASVDIEKSPFQPLKRFTALQSMRIDDRKLEGSEFAALVAGAIDTDDSMRYEKRVKIPAKDKLKVRGRWRTIKYIDDSEIWSSVLPSDGMTLCVQFPQEAKEMSARPLHREPLETTGMGAGKYCEWAIRKAVLPHQGIVFWWRCSDPPAIGDQAPVAQVEPSCAAS